MCDKCYRQCNKKEWFKEHVLTVHEGVEYYCKKCGKECRITDKLIRHLPGIQTWVWKRVYPENVSANFSLLRHIMLNSHRENKSKIIM
jgi:hypothetical protein